MDLGLFVCADSSGQQSWHHIPLQGSVLLHKENQWYSVFHPHLHGSYMYPTCNSSSVTLKKLWFMYILHCTMCVCCSWTVCGKHLGWSVSLCGWMQACGGQVYILPYSNCIYHMLIMIYSYYVEWARYCALSLYVQHFRVHTPSHWREELHSWEKSSDCIQRHQKVLPYAHIFIYLRWNWNI